MSGRYDLTIEQGATLVLQVAWTADGVPVDLTGYTARMSGRSRIGGQLLFALTSAGGGGITITPGLGTLDITMTAAATAAIATRRGVYDLELVSGGSRWLPRVVKRLLQGELIISPEVTT